MPNLKNALSLSLAAIVCAGSFVSVQAAPMPHRAVYDVALKEASDRSGITNMNGRIVYEFRGTVCDGFTTTFRFVTRLSARGETTVTDQRTTTFEDGAGENFRFVTRTFVNENEDQEIEGTAALDEGSILVELKKPEEVNLKLDQAKFPTAHIRDLMERAENGETFYQEEIFDGSDGGDRVLTTAVVIGPEKDDEAGGEGSSELLKDQIYRNVSVAYYDASERVDGQPEYSIAFKLFESGVTRDLEMDYGDFALTGTMSSLELFEAEDCEE